MLRFLLLSLFTVLTSQLAFAQPGDSDFKLRLKWFHDIQDSIKRSPNNELYKWARLDLLFSPYTELHTQPTNKLEDYLNRSNQFHKYLGETISYSVPECDMCGEFITIEKPNPASELGNFLVEHQEEFIDQLSAFIRSNRTFSRGVIGVGGFSTTAGLANYYLKRGQLYYHTGRADQAIIDYNEALKHDPDEQLERYILAAIAAYHYSRAKAGIIASYQPAMKYISELEPAIEDSSFSVNQIPKYYSYERSKLDLMKAVQDSSSYVQYLQNRSASYLSYYYFIIARKNKSGEKEEVFQLAMDYEDMIYDYLIELNPTIVAEDLIEQKKTIMEKLLPTLHIKW